MKTITSKNQRESGSAILMVVIITALAAIVLVSYMQLVKSQNYSTVRSQAWNFTVPIIEAGVEDAMAQLNAHGSTNITCDGWTNRAVYGSHRARSVEDRITTWSRFQIS